MTKLVLIDGNAIMHRSFHAIPRLTNRKGEPTNAVYGLTSMLFKIISDLKPTHLAVCFDRPEPTFRKKKYKKYQAKRPRMDEELSPQFKLAKNILSGMNITIFEKAGFEADDLLGTIAQHAKTSKPNFPKIDEVIIVTGDRDILQLVDDVNNIKVFLPVKGLSEARMMDEENVMQLLGVAPLQIVDYKALVGDSSDNYPGVKGIGPKTAVNLLNKYGDFKSIYKNLKKVDPKTRELLIKERKLGELSYQLARIITNVTIPIKLEELINWNTFSREAEAAFDEIGFRSLKERAKKMADIIEKEKVKKIQDTLFQ